MKHYTIKSTRNYIALLHFLKEMVGKQNQNNRIT